MEANRINIGQLDTKITVVQITLGRGSQGQKQRTQSVYGDVMAFLEPLTDEMVSDEYRDDLYRIFTTNYMLLKNNTVEEENIQGKIRKRKIKPKMLKRLAEELVMNYELA